MIDLVYDRLGVGSFRSYCVSPVIGHTRLYVASPNSDNDHFVSKVSLPGNDSSCILRMQLHACKVTMSDSD